MSKTILDKFTAIKIHDFEFEGEKLFYRDFSVATGDECYAHLQFCLDDNGKVKMDNESIKEFQAYRNKFIVYSLCDSEGKDVVSIDEIRNLNYDNVQALFIALNDAKNGRKKTL
jgi:hypothetical protein